MSSRSDHIRRDGFILSSLVSKDFKLKYRRSVLGVLWSVLNPLLMMIVLSAVFSYILRGDESIPCFPLYLILGQVLFNYMAAATSGGMTSIIDAASLIKKIRIDKIIFPLEKVVFELVNFAISLIAVVIVWIYYSATVPLTPNILFLPLLLFYISLFCAGMALLLAALAVFFRDVIHIWGVVITAWTYATPIFYPLSWLSPGLQAAMKFNPMFQYISYFREIFLYGTTPSLTRNLVCLGVGVVMLIIGYVVFRRSQRKFILYV